MSDVSLVRSSTGESAVGNALYVTKIAAAAGCGSLIISVILDDFKCWGYDYAKPAAIASAILVAGNAGYRAFTNREKDAKLFSVCIDGVVDSAIVQSAGLLLKSIYLGTSLSKFPLLIGGMGLLGKVNTEKATVIAAALFPFYHSFENYRTPDPLEVFVADPIVAIPLAVATAYTAAPVLGTIAEKIQKRLALDHFPSKLETT